MIIHIDAFDVIYQLVADKFFEGLLPEERGNFKKMSPELWGEIRKGEQHALVFKIIGKSSSDPTFIKRERSRIKSQSEKLGKSEIKDIFLISLLEYLDYKTSEPKFNRAKLTSDLEKEKAEILFYKFIRDHQPEYRIEHSDLYIHKENEDNDIVVPNVGDRKFDNQEIKAKLVHLINQYFSALSDKNYNKAFEYWNKESRSAEYHWSGDLLKYIKEHYIIKTIELEDFSNSFSAENEIFSFKIQYKTVLNSFSSDELDDINHEWTTLRELTKSVKKINTVLERANRNDLNLLELPIQNFFGYEIVEKVQAMTVNNSEKVRAIFPNKKIICYSNYAKILFTQISQNEYLITGWSVLAKWQIPTPDEFKE